MAHWWCSSCKEIVEPIDVTFEECHDKCGSSVEWVESVIVEKGEFLIKESVFRKMSAEDLRMFMRINDCNDINELKIIQGE